MFCFTGVMHAGLTYRQMNGLMATMEIKCLHHTALMRRREEVDPHSQNVARDSCAARWFLGVSFLSSFDIFTVLCFMLFSTVFQMYDIPLKFFAFKSLKIFKNSKHFGSRRNSELLLLFQKRISKDSKNFWRLIVWCLTLSFIQQFYIRRLNIFCQKIENVYNWMDNLWLKLENIVAKGENTMFSKGCLLQRRRKACIWGKGLMPLSTMVQLYHGVFWQNFKI